MMDDYVPSASMRQVWACELDLLKYLLDVCERNNLKIWAEGGTLLGAIRHHGFIPWDDDIDMAMFRDDYDKLLSIAGKEFKEPYFFQTAYSDKHYIRGHAQLRNSNTTAIIPMDIKQPFNQGIFIDIFVYDAVPPTPKEIDMQKRKVDLIRKFMYWRYYWYMANHSISRMFALAFAKIFAPLFNHVKMYRYLEDIFRSYTIREDGYVALNMFSYSNMNVYKHAVKDYAQTIYVAFEDMKIPVPIGYNNILTTQYGKDYMTPRRLPSMHGSNVLFDTTRPYKEVIKELRNKK